MSNSSCFSFYSSETTDEIRRRQMAPSAGKGVPGPQSLMRSASQDMSAEILIGWPPNNGFKDNQRPPVYNPEDYVQSLKKYSRRPNGNATRSIYDNSEDKINDTIRSNTLPALRNGEYKSPIPTGSDTDSEMTLRQFGSVTDLLTKLRADLRAAFPSFVQEFVATPLDGVSLLLDVLRAIQLSQTSTASGTVSTPASAMQRNTQTYQRRALLDELACLQCISLCCARSPEAGARLGTSPIGLLPLAAAATGQGIRSRVLALQLLTTACDGSTGSPSGHCAVSEALATLRLRCGEPVRFRLLVGMLNSGGGSGELQTVGLGFLNTFLESAENIQESVYIQAELHQAGFDPAGMVRTLPTSSAWMEKLRVEVRRWEEARIDVERLQKQAREAEKMRSQVVILERRVQIVQEEKAVLTAMERRLQERCAELQREVFRLQNAQSSGSSGSTGSSLVKVSTQNDKRPIALPRQVQPAQTKTRGGTSSEHEDEGISSSETGQSLSPEPPRILPASEGTATASTRPIEDEDSNTTIEDVIEELQNIVSDAERDMRRSGTKECDIVPVNLLPQPPRKTRSLAHLITSPSDAEESDYGVQPPNDGKVTPYCEDEDEATSRSSPYRTGAPTRSGFDTNTNRAILNVIMDAREQEENQLLHRHQRPAPPPQHFNGVFFMGDMTNKYPKPPPPLVGKSKSMDRMQSYGLDSIVDIVVPTDGQQTSAQKVRPAIACSLHTSAVGGFKLRTGHVNAGLYSGSHLVRENMRAHSNQGSRLTDLPSGLY
ncbi:Glycoside hydrolase, family 22 [Sergentomyia squamirostris]